MSKRLDQTREIAIVRRDPRQPLGIGERGSGFSGIAVEADERTQRVAILRMARQALAENRQSVSGAPGRMQPDGIDIAYLAWSGASSAALRTSSSASARRPSRIKVKPST